VNFSHERTVLVDRGVEEVCAEWAVARNLPSLLSHVRAAEMREHEPDIARIVVVIDGRLVETAVQCTMSENGMVCWQSLNTHIPYLLNIHAAEDESGKTAVQVTVSYDPPGILPDIVETVGGGGLSFAAVLEHDLRAYGQA
jgi:uncharacterized membrane protein